MNPITLLLIINLILIVHGRDPDAERQVPELIRSRGYEVEIHDIVTDDGYILTCHRIVNSKFQGIRKRTVMVQHGLLSSGRDFIINSPGNDCVDSNKCFNPLLQTHC